MRIRDKINKKKVSHYLFNDEEIVCMNKKYFNNNYIHKDKIRDKIKELKIECNKFCELGKILDCNAQCTIGGTIKELKELLEED